MDPHRLHVDAARPPLFVVVGSGHISMGNMTVTQWTTPPVDVDLEKSIAIEVINSGLNQKDRHRSEVQRHASPAAVKRSHVGCQSPRSSIHRHFRVAAGLALLLRSGSEAGHVW